MNKYTYIKFLLLVISIFICLLNIYGQRLDSLQLENKTLFTSFEQASTVSIDSVYRLSIKRKLPDDFAQKITQYPNLQELHLKNMRLKIVPDIVWQLENLTVLDISNNRLDSLSFQIKNLIYLESLILNRNSILTFPTEISYLSRLSYLDLWSNLIIEFPEEISELENSLKVIDMRVINMNDKRKEQLKILLPNTQFLFSNSCNCK
jgi:Leucine-rich repeat (LRR) protein